VTGNERAETIATDLVDIKLALASYFRTCGNDYWTQPISGTYDQVWLGATGQPRFFFHPGPLYVYGVRSEVGITETVISGSLVRHRTYSRTGQLLDTTYATRGDNRWN
jgi:hypothetical protein